MRKSLLFIAMFAFMASSFAQKEVVKKMTTFNLIPSTSIVKQDVVLSTKSINANLNESFDIFPPSGWNVDPATGVWVGSASVTNITPSNYGDGVFTYVDAPNLADGTEGSIITPFLNPIAGDNTLGFDVIEIYYGNATWIATGVELYIEFSTDGSTWTTSTTNVLESITDHNTETVAQTPTTLTVDLSAYDDASVQVRFRCVADYGGFGLFLDNVTGPDATIDLLANDLLLSNSRVDVAGLDFYSVIPISQFAGVQIKAEVSNIGSATQTNVVFHAIDVTNSLDLATTAQDINAGAAVDVALDISAPTQATSYVFATTVTQDETDENIDNNTGDTLRFSADPNFYFRTMNLSSYLTSYGFTGVTATTGTELGANYHISTNTTVDSISVLIYGASGTGTVVGKLYNYDGTSGDRTLLAETAPYTPGASPELKTLALISPIAVTAGQILTATAQLNIVVDTDTIKIGADGAYPGDPAVGGALYLSVNGTPDWYTTGSVPIVGITVNDATIVNNVVSNNTEINIYPNPTTGLINITNAENATINVYNTVGALVKTVSNTNSVDLSDVQNGTYIVKVITNNNIVVKNIVLAK